MSQRATTGSPTRKTSRGDELDPSLKSQAASINRPKQVTPDRPPKKKSRIREEAEDNQESDDDALARVTTTASYPDKVISNGVGNPEEGKKEPEEGEEKQSEEEEEAEENIVTGDSVMGFPKHPQTCNRDIMLNDIGYVRWARSVDDPVGRLREFVKWSKSEEGKHLEHEASGNETFTYGQHAGCTFQEISEQDPEYHSRYTYMLQKKGKSPDPKLQRYIEWFEANQRMNPSARPRSSKGAQAKRSASSSSSGNEKFSSGRHTGETFRQVARSDPDYHLRYQAMRTPNAEMRRYIEYFDAHGDRMAAERANRDTLAFHAGIYPVWAFGDHDNDEY